MTPYTLPKDPDKFAASLHSLRLKRRKLKANEKIEKRARRTLSAAERNLVLSKTGKRCHICGGKIRGTAWQADHVLAYSTGGASFADNYLPAHTLCNNYRWDYTAKEFQHILKLGVWLRTQIEKRTKVGQVAAAAYLSHEKNRIKRRRLPNQ